MLQSVNELRGYTVSARDGTVGSVRDVLFDDSTWYLRYLVADTGGRLEPKEVLLPGLVLGEADRRTKALPVCLLKEEAQGCPDIRADLPVSRQEEEAVRALLAMPSYWATAVTGALAATPRERKRSEQAHRELGREFRGADPRLHSAGEVTGCHIQATDGKIGHVQDFVVEMRTWAIRYMVVNTRNWLPGRKVLVTPDCIDRVDWGRRKVRVFLPRSSVKSCPEFESAGPMSPD